MKPHKKLTQKQLFDKAMASIKLPENTVERKEKHVMSLKTMTVVSNKLGTFK